MSRRPALDAARWLHYAATPTCTALALLSACFDGGPDSVCSAMGHASLIDGMTTMYLVMALFHAGPWLRLLPNRLIIKDL